MLTELLNKFDSPYGWSTSWLVGDLAESLVFTSAMSALALGRDNKYVTKSVV